MREERKGLREGEARKCTCFFRYKANFALTVVFPTPCRPANSITVGLDLAKASSETSPPISFTSSSRTIYINQMRPKRSSARADNQLCKQNKINKRREAVCSQNINARKKSKSGYH